MMTEGFELVAFDREHILPVAELEKACFSNPISARNLEALLISGIGKGFVCIETKSGNAVAYGGVMVAADEAQILNIATRSDFRRMGLGRAVVEAILDFSRSRGAEFITLEVREGNVSAISLYEGLGFYEVGRIKKYYSDPTEDALILKKELSSKSI